MKEALRESKVIFDPEKHEYTLNGRQLSGVTPIVAWLFPETYKGIPQQVLEGSGARQHDTREGGAGELDGHRR